MDGDRQCDSGRTWPLHFFALDPAEQLVLGGFRAWVTGWVEMSAAPWERAWSDMARRLGEADGRQAAAHLAALVDDLRGNARRAIHYRPPRSAQVCADEICVVSLTGAAQRGEWLRAEASARWLVRAAAAAVLAQRAGALGALLAARGLVLPDRAAHRGRMVAAWGAAGAAEPRVVARRGEAVAAVDLAVSRF